MPCSQPNNKGHPATHRATHLATHPTTDPATDTHHGHGNNIVMSSRTGHADIVEHDAGEVSVQLWVTFALTVTSQIIFPQYVVQNGVILSPNGITNNPTLGSTSSPDSISMTARNQLTINRGVRLSQHVVNHVGAGHIHQVQIALPLCPPTSQLPTYLTTGLTRNQSNLIRL